MLWTAYRDHIQAVSAADVQRVARTYLVPERMAILVVGDQKEIDVDDDRQPVKLVALAPAGPCGGCRCAIRWR